MKRMTTKTAGLLRSAWEDWDALVSTAAPDALLHREHGASSVGWTLAHVSNQLDGWVNVRFQQHKADDVIGSDDYSIGGSGEAPEVAVLLAAVERIRSRAWDFVKNRSEEQLEATIPYDGSIAHLRSSGLVLRHAILRIAAHHYLHLGEAAAELGRQGVAVPDLPGRMTATI
jgi:hypothetical protein